MTLLEAPGVKGAASSHNYTSGTPITGMLKMAVKWTCFLQTLLVECRKWGQEIYNISLLQCTFLLNHHLRSLHFSLLLFRLSMGQLSLKTHNYSIMMSKGKCKLYKMHLSRTLKVPRYFTFLRTLAYSTIPGRSVCHSVHRGLDCY